VNDLKPTEHLLETAETMQPDPLWSIGAVTSFTGIPEATLRVWERRYHFPTVMRSAGGHRQYRQHEVLQLAWVKMQLDAGMRAGRAISAWQTTPRHASVSAALHESLAPHACPDASLAALQPLLLDALLGYQGAHAAALLDQATAQHSLRRVALDLIAPTLAAVGECWSQGEIEIPMEHFATNFLRHQLLLWMRSSPPPFRVQPIVLACAPEELHEGSLLLLGVLLSLLRWPFIYLGQSLPLTDLPALIERVSPALIVFVAMSDATAQALADWPTWLKRDPDKPPLETAETIETVETRPLILPLVTYGGRAFTNNPALAEVVPGVLLGTTLDEGSQRLHRLMLHLNVLEQ
jgi:DNA-binding transcriptional MerR regulator